MRKVFTGRNYNLAKLWKLRKSKNITRGRRFESRNKRPKDHFQSTYTYSRKTGK